MRQHGSTTTTQHRSTTHTGVGRARPQHRGQRTLAGAALTWGLLTAVLLAMAVLEVAAVVLVVGATGAMGLGALKAVVAHTTEKHTTPTARRERAAAE